MSQSAMSMPLIAWVSVPPRPIQKLFWWSFSQTRSGSSAFSPRKSGSSTWRAAATSPPLVKTLPCPVRPASVCTAMRLCTESSGRISADQPPFGLSPSRGTETMDRIRTASIAAAGAADGWFMFALSKGGGDAAIDQQDLAGDIARVLGAEEDGGPGDVRRQAGAAEGQAAVLQIDLLEPLGLV